MWNPCQSQSATESLAPQQLQAIELLLSGQTLTAVAGTVGVRRETVHRWQREDWPFIAAVNTSKRELHDAAPARLLSVWSKAADNLANAIEEGDLKASVLLLKGLGGLAGVTPHIGIEKVEQLAEEAEIIQEEAQTAALLRRSLATL